MTNIRKYPEKAINMGITGLRRLGVSTDYFIRIGKSLNIDNKYLNLIVSLLNKEIEYKNIELLPEEKESLIKKISTLRKKVEKIKGKKHPSAPVKNNKYGGGNFFDGKERKPVNKLANLWTVKITKNKQKL